MTKEQVEKGKELLKQIEEGEAKRVTLVQLKNPKSSRKILKKIVFEFEDRQRGERSLDRDYYELSVGFSKEDREAVVIENILDKAIEEQSTRVSLLELALDKL